MGKTTYYQKPKRIEKLSRNQQLELMFDLVNSFSIVKSPVETINFLEDLFSAKEIKNLSKRLRIAKLLIAEETYEEIVTKLHCSFASVAKVSVWLAKNGTGFKNVISKLPVKYDIPKDLPKMPIEFQLPKMVSSLYQYSKARAQQKPIEKFFEGIKEKGNIDKSLREQFSDEFRA